MNTMKNIDFVEFFRDNASFNIMRNYKKERNLFAAIKSSMS